MKIKTRLADAVMKILVNQVLIVSLAWMGLGMLSSAWANLEWERKLIEVKADVADSEAWVSFPFKNVGDKPITIHSVKSSCGCTTVTLDKKTYEPGEEGEIKTHFTFGERVGLQEKLIAVASDDVEEPNSVLTLRVAIAELIKIEPAVLQWKVGEEKIARSAKIHVLQEGQVKLRKAHSVDSKMEVELKEIIAGKEYEVFVKPVDTGDSLTSIIRVDAEIEGGKRRAFQFHSQILQEVKGYGYGTRL